MSWNFEEAVAYYKAQGAPSDQSVLVNLLREIQSENGGSIPKHIPAALGETLGVKETFILAVIKRIPSLRLADTHLLELCAGPNCGKNKALAASAEKLRDECGGAFALKYMPCMRMCGKGPNIRWNGTLYNGATEELLRTLTAETKK